LSDATQLKHALRSSIYDQSLDVVRFILERAPDIYNEPDEQVGEYPIEAAAIRGNAAIEAGQNVFELAQTRGLPGLIELLRPLT
jgi:hypothetical protein